MTQQGAQPPSVKVMNIATRFARQRERCVGMTDADRAWRRQYLLDQNLAANEPVFVPELWNATHNPIRRFYRAPLDKLFSALQPALGDYTPYFRWYTGKFFFVMAAAFGTFYYFKYNGNDWTKKGGWRMTRNKPLILPGESKEHLEIRTSPKDYANRGFKNSPI